MQLLECLLCFLECCCHTSRYCVLLFLKECSSDIICIYPCYHLRSSRNAFSPPAVVAILEASVSDSRSDAGCNGDSGVRDFGTCCPFVAVVSDHLMHTFVFQ
jgi:hypothetical protein